MTLFLIPHELTKKVLQSSNEILWCQIEALGTEPKEGFSFLSRNTRYRARLKGPLSFFWRCETFFELSSQRVPPSNIFGNNGRDLSVVAKHQNIERGTICLEKYFKKCLTMKLLFRQTPP